MTIAAAAESDDVKALLGDRVFLGGHWVLPVEIPGAVLTFLSGHQIEDTVSKTSGNSAPGVRNSTKTQDAESKTRQKLKGKIKNSAVVAYGSNDIGL